MHRFYTRRAMRAAMLTGVAVGLSGCLYTVLPVL